MKVYCSSLTAITVFSVVMLAGSLAFGDLAAYWSFDSDFTSSGSRTGMDGTAIENGGTVTIGTGTGEYKVGSGALKINDPVGAGKNALLIDAAVYEGTLPPATQTITLSGWYKVEDVGSDGSDPWLYLWETNPAYTASCSINTGASSSAQQNPRWAYGAINSLNDIEGPAYNESDWNHVVTVFNPTTKRAKFYHNGVLCDYRAIPDDILNSLHESTQLYLGASRDLSNDVRNFDGYLDEVAVFDHEPTAEVIQGLYDGTYTPATAPSDAVTTEFPNVYGDWSIKNTISIQRPNGMAFNPNDGKLYVATRGNDTVSSPGTAPSNVYAIESDGSATALFTNSSMLPDRPFGLAIDSNGSIFYSEDYGGSIYKCDTSDPVDPRIAWVTDLIGDGTDADPCPLAIVPSTFDGGTGSLVNPGDALVVDHGSGGYEKIYVWSTTSNEGEFVLHDDSDKADGVGSLLIAPQGLAISDSAIYVADRTGNAIYSVSPVDGSLTQLTTDRPIINPLGMAVDPTTNELYVMVDDSDVAGSELIKIDTLTGEVTTVTDMLTDTDKFWDTWSPVVPQMVFSDDGSHLYIIEPDADTIYDLMRSTGIPGDTNNDGIVDETDANMVASKWGSSTTAGASEGDFNGDGVVNAADASIMAANWGNHNNESEGNAVPEPGTLATLLALIGTCLINRWRRC